LLTAIAAFAEAFVNPLAPAVALALALLLPGRGGLVRLAAGGAGCVLGSAAHLGEGLGVLLLSALGGAAALLLHAEIALHLIAPLLRWLRHCLVTGWELVGLAAAALLRLLRGPGEAGRAPPPPPSPSPPGEDRT
jgi:hypothetical protein